MRSIVYLFRLFFLEYLNTKDFYLQPINYEYMFGLWFNTASLDVRAPDYLLTFLRNSSSMHNIVVDCAATPQ